ncbi:MAG: twin-arginine translocation signal domain-containing protein, partial [Akkermansia sp.]|nr:twin-arginine translocation signal domain-containing protein [Akkermansia sp.]
MENSYHQTTRRNFLNQLGLAAAGMTTGNTALATTQY